MSKYRTVLPAILAFACVLVLAACSSGPVAARFDGHTISEEEVTAYTQEFREESGLSDDAQWANYLTTSALTTQTWRERAIRQLADELLIGDKAAELGITADAQDVDEHIAQDKQQAGVAADDEQAWADYLAQQGTTPEKLRERYEFSSIEQQVFKAELDFSDELQAQMCDDYISANLADQVVRRYSVVEFASDDDAAAKACLDELRGLSDDALAARFAELAAETSADEESAAAGGDIGWDFIYDETGIDPKLKLRSAKLGAGKLYGKVLKGEDALRVVMCTERHEFVGDGMHYATIESESLKAVLADLATVSSWTAKCMQYLSDLEEAADIQVTQVPEGLPYDVTESE